MDPQQEIFTELIKRLQENEKIDCEVFDTVLPPDGTPYPFIYIGDSHLTDQRLKGVIIGRVVQTVHVWHSNPRQRGTVSDLMLQIKTIVRGIHETGNFYWDVRSIDQKIIPDDTTKTRLLHGVLEITFSFN